MKYCLLDEKEVSRFSDKIDCSTEEHPILRYKARNGNREFGIEIISHPRERDSTEGKDSQTPDEILKHRDFVIGKLKAEPNERFSQWNMKEFKEGTINLAHPDADFELKPLLPAKKVFIAGYPKDRSFVISHGFLNLTEHNNRGYFAAAIDVYAPAYLESQEISTDTRWGIRVENQMSGGPVVDSSGHLVGIVVNSADDNTAVLSIENVVETFFSSSATGTYPFFISIPTQRPLYLKGERQECRYVELKLNFGSNKCSSPKSS
jgi:hypothetical protein